MAFDRNRAARAEIQEEGCGIDLYEFLDEKPPDPPALPARARAHSLPPGGRFRHDRATRSRSDTRPSPGSAVSDTLEGPLIEPPLVDLYVFLGETPPPQHLVRRRDLDLRRAWAEVWWRWNGRRRAGDAQSQVDESLGPSCDYQQLSEGPGASVAQSTANSFRDFWLSLGGGPLSMDLGATRSDSNRRGTDPAPRGRDDRRDVPVTGIAGPRARSVFEPRASDRYHALEGEPRDPDPDLQWPCNEPWDPADLDAMARFGVMPMGYGPWNMY
ncbi:unnamed protein product [Durusdinium trenchii]